MKKSGLIAVLGLMIMFGGCVPFGVAIKNVFNANEVLTESISQNQYHQTALFKVNTQHSILPAIKIHVITDEINKNTSDSHFDEYDGKYRFPIKLTVKDRNNKKLYEYVGELSWKQGTRSYDLKEVNSRHGEVIVEIDLDKYIIPPPGEITISVLIGEDSFYYAKLQSAQLIVYDNVHQHSATILTGVSIIAVGILVFLIGIVMLILKQSQISTEQSTRITRENNKRDDSMNDDTNLSNMRPGPSQSDINTSAMLCHLATFAGYIIPFGGILGPLIAWQVKKNDDPFIDRHGVAAVNFHLSMMIYYFVAMLTMFIAVGFILVPALALYEIVIVIIASIKANNGEEFTYPLAIPFIKPTQQ